MALFPASVYTAPGAPVWAAAGSGPGPGPSPSTIDSPNLFVSTLTAQNYVSSLRFVAGYRGTMTPFIEGTQGYEGLVMDAPLNGAPISTMLLRARTAINMNASTINMSSIVVSSINGLAPGGGGQQIFVGVSQLVSGTVTVTFPGFGPSILSYCIFVNQFGANPPAGSTVYVSTPISSTTFSITSNGASPLVSWLVILAT